MTEYWPVKKIAAYWGVSLSRARSLIARAGLQRHVVYDADEVRAVPRLRQGQRTDLHPPESAARAAQREEQQ